MKEKKAIEEFEKKSSRNGGIGKIRAWKRAMEAVRVTEEKVVAIGFRLEEEERELQVLDIPLKIFKNLLTQ